MKYGENDQNAKKIIQQKNWNSTMKDWNCILYVCAQCDLKFCIYWHGFTKVFVLHTKDKRGSASCSVFERKWTISSNKMSVEDADCQAVNLRKKLLIWIVQSTQFLLVTSSNSSNLDLNHVSVKSYGNFDTKHFNSFICKPNNIQLSLPFIHATIELVDDDIWIIRVEICRAQLLETMYTLLHCLVQSLYSFNPIRTLSLFPCACKCGVTR